MSKIIGISYHIHKDVVVLAFTRKMVDGECETRYYHRSEAELQANSDLCAKLWLMLDGVGEFGPAFFGWTWHRR